MRILDLFKSLFFRSRLGFSAVSKGVDGVFNFLVEDSKKISKMLRIGHLPIITLISEFVYRVCIDYFDLDTETAKKVAYHLSFVIFNILDEVKREGFEKFMNLVRESDKKRERDSLLLYI